MSFQPGQCGDLRVNRRRDDSGKPPNMKCPARMTPPFRLTFLATLGRDVGQVSGGRSIILRALAGAPLAGLDDARREVIAKGIFAPPQTLRRRHLYG